MPRKLETIGFDADDTLWHTEAQFQLTQDRFVSVLAEYADDGDLRQRLLAAERRNLGHYGFGVKGFVLSMIETAIEVTDARVSARVIAEILEAGQEMLRHPVELLPHVRDVVTTLAGSHRLVLITKGDLLDQERKLAQSGLGAFFEGVEIVSDKTPDIYAAAFTRHGTGTDTAMMIGNSLRSDVIPALKAGAWAVHVPYAVTWALEEAKPPTDHARFRAVADLGEVPALVLQP